MSSAPWSWFNSEPVKVKAPKRRASRRSCAAGRKTVGLSRPVIISGEGWSEWVMVKPCGLNKSWGGSDVAPILPGLQGYRVTRFCGIIVFWWGRHKKEKNRGLIAPIFLFFAVRGGFLLVPIRHHIKHWIIEFHIIFNVRSIFQTDAQNERNGLQRYCFFLISPNFVGEFLRQNYTFLLFLPFSCQNISIRRLITRWTIIVGFPG